MFFTEATHFLVDPYYALSTIVLNDSPNTAVYTVASNLLNVGDNLSVVMVATNAKTISLKPFRFLAINKWMGVNLVTQHIMHAR